MSINTTRNWLIYYQGLLAIGGIFIFFTRLDGYLTVNQLLISPVGLILPYSIFTIPLFIRERGKYPSRSVFCWCLGYFIVTFLSYSFFPKSEFSLRAFIDRSFSSLFLLVTTFLFADQRVQSWTRYALIAATGMGVFNNFYQILNPSAFGGLVEGRAVGLYLDPNDCANTLILGMIVTVGSFPKKLRIPWILIVGFGVVLTFSRGGILGWIFVVIMIHLTRVISFQKSLLCILVMGMLLFFVVQLGSEWIGDSSNIYKQLDSTALKRVESIIGGDEVLEDSSSMERKEVAEKGWEMFVERPIFGYGIGSTFDYSNTHFSVSTHNMFLLYAAEYGIIGIPILPLAIYAVIHRARGDTRKLGIIFAVFILLISLFSHTILSLNNYLIPFALMAVMSEKS
ncbi:O-antigen ligase family protein (plasmid) [Nostoc sp. C052]|uniref:O-antigen ligase family protein n=1 Tax=Nostoc sp. C052 TaxID=2576902 RepID=UPI0015C391CF|nr:O-antigen ligase family protein [Nostoc sp. C052]QLE45992.1 O-antigen ligase family protein [Nostoc sp. C052]